MLFLVLISILVLILICFMDADLTLLFHHLFSAKKDYQNQVVWITGASSGIGEHLAYAFAESNAKLALSGLNLERLNNVKETCISLYKREEKDVLLVPFSIDKFEEHGSNVKKVLDHFGQIDILVNNAGHSQRARFEDIDIVVDQKLFNVNVFGTVNLTRKVLKHFLERGRGHVVVTSSLAGKLGVPFCSAYMGSKHALHGYFECLRTEICGKNIDVTLACPGPVFSRINERYVASKPGVILDQAAQLTDRKMKTDRCSQLMLTAISNKLDECWISQQPLLSLFYCSQYIPTIYRKLFMKKIFNEKVASKLLQTQ